MNIGKDNRHPKYVCDKCGQEIPYKYQEGFKVYRYFSSYWHYYTPSKKFDLCENCEKKLQEWLQEKEILTTEEMIDRFPVWKGE